MGIMKKKLIRWFLGLGFIMSLVLIAPFFLLSDSFEYWAKDHIRSILHTYHPLGHFRNAVETLKEFYKRTPSSKSALAILSPSSLGFVGNRVEVSSDILSWIAPFSDRIPPDDHPSKSRIHSNGQTRPITLEGLKGETLSFQLVLRSKNPVDNLSVRLIPDPSSDRSCITVHRFLEYYLRLMVHEGGDSGPLKLLNTPDPLIPFTDPYSPGRSVIPSVSLKPDINQPIWFDVHFRTHCPGGNYSGLLEVRSSGHIVRRTQVTFKILNVALPKQVDLDRWMEIYTGLLRSGEMIQNEQSFQKIITRYFIMAHRYGFVTNPCGDIVPEIQWDWNTGKPQTVSWDHYDQIYGPLLSGQLTGSSPNVFCLPIPEDALGVRVWGGFSIYGGTPTPLDEWDGIPDKATQELARVIVQHWQEKGWPIERAFAYPIDEPTHFLAHYPFIYQFIAKVTHSLYEGSNHKIRLMLTDAPYIWGKEQKGHQKKVLNDVVDIWAADAPTYIPERIQKFQREGKRAWFYQSGPPFIASGDLSSMGVGFRMWFWTAWKYRVNGLFYWVSDFWTGNTRATDPFIRQGGGDGVIFYPGHQLHFIGYPDIDGPLPSVRMAQWRRGFEDYKYLVLLKQNGKGDIADKIVNGLVHRALDEGGYIPWWRNPLWNKPGDWSHDPREWHKARIKMANIIEGIYKK